MNENQYFNDSKFFRKLSMIHYFYHKCHLSYEEIALIIDSRSEIVQLYCKRLLN